jgi:hypothetical protein
MCFSFSYLNVERFCDWRWRGGTFWPRARHFRESCRLRPAAFATLSTGLERSEEALPGQSREPDYGTERAFRQRVAAVYRDGNDSRVAGFPKHVVTAGRPHLFEAEGPERTNHLFSVRGRVARHRIRPALRVLSESPTV